MQDKYAGDIGDFGKFVLLRHAAGLLHGTGRLGINWYRTILPGEPADDGRHIHYLTDTTPLAGDIRGVDPDLSFRLRGIVEGNNRSIRGLEGAGLLPSETLFFSDPLPNASIASRDREARRTSWYSESIRRLESSGIIFVDPDNGFATPSVRRTQSRAGKYAFADEVAGYFRVCDIIIVYQHRDRSPAKVHYERLESIRQELGNGIRMRIVRFKRVSVRDYVFLFRESMAGSVRALVDRLTAEPYDILFSEIGSAQGRDLTIKE